MKLDQTPVVIAGAGPVGMTLAMDLARLRVPSIVLERRRLVPPNPRCNTTNARSMELFRRLGCAHAVRDAGLPADFSTDIVYMTRLTRPRTRAAPGTVSRSSSSAPTSTSPGGRAPRPPHRRPTT